MLLKYSQQTTQIKPADVEKVKKTLAPYIQHLQAVSAHVLYQLPESFINTPFDEKSFGACWNLKKTLVSQHLKHIFVLGIGGSLLGTKAVYNICLDPDNRKELIAVDFLDKVTLHKIRDTFAKIKSAQDYLVVVASKSGKTYETLSAFEHLQTMRHDVLERSVVITTENSPLWHQAHAKNIHKLAIPDAVAGRYSVFTAIGLFPLACADVDVLALIEGAMKARADLFSQTIPSQTLDLTAVSFLANTNKKPIANLFITEREFTTFGEWFKEIYAESLGKAQNLSGNTVHYGITPMTTIAPADYHSLLQLLLGGPNDKFTLFLRADNVQDDYLNKTYDYIRKTFEQNKLAHVELTLPTKTAYEIGYLMMSFMIHTMLLGVLMGINPFDQPEIEGFKHALA